MSSSPPIAANVSPAGAIPVSSTAALPPVVVKLLDFLERQQQVGQIVLAVTFRKKDFKIR